ncbi:MAG: hypothetical protein IKJ01_08860, partial [Lachnospiraceae bacterium]|nr:hypothetical protein [Lachnospiraceae bacterium]
MKIRMDFVTNSSSSSFIVNFKMEFQNGELLQYDSEEWAGDEDYEDIFVDIKNEKNQTTFTENITFSIAEIEHELELEDYDDKEEKLKALKELPCMKYMLEESLEELIEFWEVGEYPFEYCRV